MRCLGSRLFSAIAALAIMGVLGVASAGAASADARVVADPNAGAQLRDPPGQNQPGQPASPSPSASPSPQAGTAATAVRDALLDVAGDMQYYGAGIGVVGVLTMAGPGVLKPAGACIAAGGAFIAMGGMFLDRTVKQLFPGQRSVATATALRSAARQRVGTVPRRFRGVAAAVIALRNHVRELQSSTLALTTAVDAAGAAQTAQAQRSALNTAADDALTLADLVDAEPLLRERFAATLTSARVRLSLTEPQLASLDRTVARRGLPPRLVAALRRFGAPQSWIAEYDAAARSVGPVTGQLAPVQQGPTDITQLVRDPTVTAEQQATAAALRGLAAVWQTA